MKLDTQQIEILGLSILKAYLISEGYEVAKPERDNGIDLIMYQTKCGFTATPIQMKSATEASFSIDRGYNNIPGLCMAYIWNVTAPTDSKIYFMRYDDAVGIGDSMGYTKTKSWIDDGMYATTSPSVRLKGHLSKYLAIKGYMNDNKFV